MIAIVACCALTALLGLGGLTGTLPDEGMPSWLWLAILLAGAVQAVGAGLVAAGARKPGAVVAIVGAVPVVPLGLLGIWGARTVLDQVASEDVERRRRAHG